MMPVHNTRELLSTLLREDWRIMSMQFDIPSNPQILGQLAHAAGIEETGSLLLFLAIASLILMAI